MNRFYLHPDSELRIIRDGSEGTLRQSDLFAGDLVTLPEAVAQQATRVLRLREGDDVRLFRGDGREWAARLDTVTRTAVIARLLDAAVPETELRTRLEVAVALLKGEKLDWVVQKLTELGAQRITLLRTARTVVDLPHSRWPARAERLTRIVCEAAEQCGRVCVPELGAPRSFADQVRWSGPGLQLLLDPHSNTLLREAVPAGGSPLTFLVGPEGGFSPEELALACEAGIRTVRLGRTVLRAETAAITAAAQAVALLEPGSPPG